MFRRVKKLFLEFIPTFVKTGILSKVPALFAFVEIRPGSAILNVTGRCNSKCLMCKQWREPAAVELSTEDWKKIILDLKKNGIKNVHFTGGEPLLRRDLPELVSFATGKGLNAGMTTNGLLMKEDVLEGLIAAKLRSIAVSMDALGGKYDKVRGVENSFDKVNEAVMLIAEAKKEKRIYAYLDFTLMNDTIAEFESVKALADEVDLPVAVCLLDKSSFIFNLEDNKKRFWITEDSDFKRLEDLIDVLKKEKTKKPASLLLNFPMFDFIRRYFRDPRQKQIPCVVSQDRVIVDSSGKFFGGCMSMGSFGNIKETPFGELKKDKKYRIAKKNMFYKKCDGCSCGYQFNIQHTPSLVARDMFERAIRCIKKN